MRLTIGNLVIQGNWRGNVAFNGHPCTNAVKNEPAISGAQRCGAGFRGDDEGPLSRGATNTSHRHLAVPHRSAGGEAFGGIDDGVGVDAVMAIEIADAAGLAEMLDAERLDPVA